MHRNRTGSNPNASQSINLLLGIESLFFGCAACSIVTLQTELLRLPKKGYKPIQYTRSVSHQPANVHRNRFRNFKKNIHTKTEGRTDGHAWCLHAVSSHNTPNTLWLTRCHIQTPTPPPPAPYSPTTSPTGRTITYNCCEIEKGGTGKNGEVRNSFFDCTRYSSSIWLINGHSTRADSATARLKHVVLSKKDTCAAVCSQ